MSKNGLFAINFTSLFQQGLMQRNLEDVVNELSIVTNDLMVKEVCILQQYFLFFCFCLIVFNCMF